MTEITLTQELVRELFSCDPETGILVWRDGPKGLRKSARSGQVAGYLEKRPHKCSDGNRDRLKVPVRCPGGRWRKAMSHRVVWVYFNGEIPPGLQVDHINRDSMDNRLCNLRLATARQNTTNGSAHRVNGSHRYIGVYVDKKHQGQYKARCRSPDGKDNHVIYSYCPEVAAKTRDLIASLWNREFAKLNFPEIADLSDSEKISEFLKLGGNPRLVSNNLP